MRALIGERRTQLVIALIALLLALPGLLIDVRMFFACWLVVWWYLLGLLLGGLVNLWIHRLSGGRWGYALRPAALTAASRLPWLLLLFLPLVFGLPQLHVWLADPGGDWARDIAKPAFLRLWLEPVFFWIRMLVYAALWWWLARPASVASKGRAATSLVLYMLSGTLAAVDLLMAFMPGWFSTAFGLVVLSAQALGGTALSVVLLAPRRLVPEIPKGAPPLWRDFGNLLLMWLMVWAYVAFFEFQIIWAENLPYEIQWYVPRLQTGWWWVGVALVVLMLGIPLLALLQRRLKDRPGRLYWIALPLLLMQLVNSAWLVLPSVAAHSALGWWLVPLFTLGMGLLLFGGIAPEVAAAADTPPTSREVQHA